MIYIFYHIYCNEFTLPILKEQMELIVSSGLYETVDKIYCFITGNQTHIQTCSDTLVSFGEKIYIEDIGINDTSYERFTLLKIKKYICDTDKFLYLHTKGVTKPTSEHVKYWRQYMQYFLITKHTQCIEYLDSFDTVGVNFQNAPSKHYSGNFWWTHGSYFSKLPNTIDHHYCAPEFYIGLANPHYKELFSTGNMNLYGVSIKPDKYMQT